MKASDFMVGDWINPENPMQVREVGEDWLNGTRDHYELKRVDGDIHPIPLSDDWLGKLGFELFNPPNAIDLRWILSDEANFTIVSIWEKDKDGKYFCKETGKEVKYVHELQQIVRVFTGEPLTIKPDANNEKA